MLSEQGNKTNEQSEMDGALRVRELKAQEQSLLRMKSSAAVWSDLSFEEIETRLAEIDRQLEEILRGSNFIIGGSGKTYEGGIGQYDPANHVPHPSFNGTLEPGSDIYVVDAEIGQNVQKGGYERLLPATVLPRQLPYFTDHLPHIV